MVTCSFAKVLKVVWNRSQEMRGCEVMGCSLSFLSESAKRKKEATCPKKACSQSVRSQRSGEAVGGWTSLVALLIEPIESRADRHWRTDL